MTFFYVLYIIIMVITVVQLMSAWFLDSELSTCYVDLQGTLNNISSTELLVVLGDLNVRVV